ncbi:MAG: hypothetical protein B0D92_08725 [Spirochaeta sp. LUC14_002_19_P3]|nr:MAG: hypothetical protein B0D92_08725 [Spirochaeta sp. LUC14_002_19_P3]
MKSVLLVSPYPYTPSNRGMDMLTQGFELSGWRVHHLRFPSVFYSVRAESSSVNVEQLSARRTLLPYIDALMHRWPRFVFNRIMAAHRRSVSTVDWRQYDTVVLESGKPLFLLDMIPAQIPVIYRQSDPMRLFLGRNPHYLALEDGVFERGRYLLLVKERFIQTVPPRYRDKIRVIHNGFRIPENISFPTPYLPGTINVVYAGLAPLDTDCLRVLGGDFPGVTFHLFGTGIRGSRHWLRRCPNIVHYGFVSQDTFLPYLANADVYIFPFKRSERMNNVGLTSKHLTAMRFGLPIISFPMGPAEEFEGMFINFCADSAEFSRALGRMVQERPRLRYNIPWEKFSSESILQEYVHFIETL